MSRAPVLTIRVAPEVYEEVKRLAKANKKTQSEVARLLLEDAIARRSEELTDTQFQMVENRLTYMERRFSGWMVKLARAIAESLYYTEQLATVDLDKDDKRIVNQAAEKFVREFMKMKHDQRHEDGTRD
jgi:predicted CopG family antitoxin